VAAVHAGWRGTVAGVAPAAVRTLAARYGIPPEGVTALLGPAIRPCCYEVGDAVTNAVRDRFPQWAAEVLTPGPKGRAHLDLPGLNRLQLADAGVADVRDGGGCTCCEAGAFDSYRRDGAGAGRMVSWIRAAA